jgi:HAD superfamily hydrolase (TIGR01509 family)
MQSIQDLLKEKQSGEVTKKKNYISTEFQDYGFRLATKLGNTKQASMYIRMAKNKPRALLEQAFSFTIDYPNAENKHKIFLWKLKELEKEREDTLKERNKGLRIILLDLDGVVISEEKPFSERYAENNLVDIEDLNLFFNNEFKDCLVGKADLKKSIKKYMNLWRWQGSVDQFIDNWIKEEIQYNSEIVDAINKLNREKYKVYICSNQEENRANYLEKKISEVIKVDGYFFSCRLGCSKNEVKFFRKVLKHFIVEKSQIYYMDDSQKNIKTAAKTGINTYHYPNQSIEKLIDDSNK